MSGAGAIGLLPLRLGIARIDIRWRLTAAVVIELLYMWLSRVVYGSDVLSFAEVEMWRTPLRLVTALAHWLLMADVVFGERATGAPLPTKSMLIGLALLFGAAPLSAGGFHVPFRDAAIIAVSSIPVAIHEELFFRGVLQTTLVKRLGPGLGIGVGSLCFAFFHVGVATPGILNLLALALAGLVFGIIYFRTASMFAVTVVHAADDALFAIPWVPPFGLEFGVVMVGMAVIALVPTRPRQFNLEG